MKKPEETPDDAQGYWISSERGVSASRLSFPLQLVILIVTSALAAMGGMWGSQYGLRSDVRDILTRMEGQVKVDELKATLDAERAAAMKAAIDDMRRRVELQQYEVQGLKESIITLKNKGG